MDSTLNTHEFAISEAAASGVTFAFRFMVRTPGESDE